MLVFMCLEFCVRACKIRFISLCMCSVCFLSPCLTLSLNIRASDLCSVLSSLKSYGFSFFPLFLYALLPLLKHIVVSQTFFSLIHSHNSRYAWIRHTRSYQCSAFNAFCSVAFSCVQNLSYLAQFTVIFLTSIRCSWTKLGTGWQLQVWNTPGNYKY